MRTHTVIVAYQLKDIEKVASIPNSVLSENGGLTGEMKTTAYSVADLYKFVKLYDKDFSAGPEVSEAALNPDGTPKVFFHGTRSEFDEFLKSTAGRSSTPALAGFWFTDSKAGALAFAENTWYGDKDATVYDVYLSMRNPKIYESEDTTARVAELEKETAKIDSEMSLLDSVYNYSEKGERFHRYREYDRSKRRRSNIDEWDAFAEIVSGSDAHNAYYLNNLSAEERKLVKADNEIIDFLGRGKNKPRIYVPANLSEDIARWFDVPGRKAIDTLRNKYIGNMTITSDESARGIDSLYGELSEKFGQVYHIKRQKTESAGGQLGVSPSSPVPDTDSTHSIADLYKFVKTYDKYFTPAHSVSPEALNPDGTPKVFFHGTRSEFDEFLKSTAGRSSTPALAGFWFTDSKAGALAFAENTWYGDKDATVYDVYLSMRNPKIYESEDTTARVAELEKETAKIDSEMSLLDSVYNYSEKGERFHRYREYDRSKRRRSNIDEWEPFRVIVEKYDAECPQHKRCLS